MAPPRLFDAHLLLVSEDRGRYPPNPLGPPLAPGELEPFPSAAQWLAQVDGRRVERAVVVQRSRVYGFDNSYVCDMAAAHPRRFRAVCSIDARDPHCGEQVSYWIRARGGSGIRLMEPGKGHGLSWLDGAEARRAWRMASDLDVPVAVHFFSWNRTTGLAALASLLREYPSVAVILDGLGAMRVESGPPDYGVDTLLSALAEFPRTFAKLTTMPLARLESAALVSHEAPLVRRLISLFGVERLLWGSDLVSADESYSRAVQRALAATDTLTEHERDCVLHGTASRLYPHPV